MLPQLLPTLTMKIYTDCEFWFDISSSNDPGFCNGLKQYLDVRLGLQLNNLTFFLSFFLSLFFFSWVIFWHVCLKDLSFNKTEIMIFPFALCPLFFKVNTLPKESYSSIAAMKNNKWMFVKAPGDPHCVLSLDVKALILIWSSMRTSFAIYLRFCVTQWVHVLK